MLCSGTPLHLTCEQANEQKGGGEEATHKIRPNTNQASHFSKSAYENSASKFPHWKIKCSVEAKGTHDTKQDCRFESFSLVAACGNLFSSFFLLSVFICILPLVMQRSSCFIFSFICPTAEFPLLYFCFGFYLELFALLVFVVCVGMLSPASILWIEKKKCAEGIYRLYEWNSFFFFCIRCSEPFLNSGQTTEIAENVDIDGDTMFVVPTTQNQHTFPFEGSAYAEIQ